MPKGTYLTASAMFVESRALDIAARNLAHAQTTGYRREVFLRTGFAEELKQRGHQGDLKTDGGAGVLSDGSYFTQQGGARETTGATYDLAIEGDGFFRVSGPGNQTLLTRAGHFVTDAQGRLSTPEGWLVNGQGGAITIPLDAQRITIDHQGRINAFIEQDGVSRDAVIDQLRIVGVEQPDRMTAYNGQYFDPGSQAQRDVNESAGVHQGFLEKSNVEPIRELVDLIAIQRRYDSAQKAMREMNQIGNGFSDLLRGS